jgi:hypothetical protein
LNHEECRKSIGANISAAQRVEQHESKQQIERADDQAQNQRYSAILYNPPSCVVCIFAIVAPPEECSQPQQQQQSDCAEEKQLDAIGQHTCGL